MTVQNRLTYAELMELVKEPGRKVHWRLEGVLMVKGQPVRFTNITSFFHLHHFYKDFYGNFRITLKMDIVAYRFLLKHPNEIQFQLTKAEQSATGVVQSNAKRYSQLFNAFIIDPKDPSLMARMGSDLNRDGTISQAANQFEVQFEMIEPIVQAFRYEQVGGIYKIPEEGLTVEKFLKVQMGYRLGPSESPEALKAPDFLRIRGVDIITPDNTRLYEHIVVPDGKHLYELPRWIQDQYGVYGSGLGFSLYRGWVFIFPLLNYTLFTKREKTLTILNVPQEEIPTMEKTFLHRSEQLYVFATGDSDHVDMVNQIQLNRGNGIRFSRARDLINPDDDFAKTSTNKTTFSRADRMVEFIVDKRKDELVNARHAETRFTDNPFTLASELSDSLGCLVKVQWDRSAPELLYPGMQIKYLYKDKDVISELQGTLIGIDSVTRTQTGALGDQHYITTTELIMNLERRDLKVAE